MDVFRLIIAGGRDFSNYPLLQKKVDVMLSAKRFSHQIEIVSGNAKGADMFGEEYAKTNGFLIKQFPPAGRQANPQDMTAIKKWQPVPMPASVFGTAPRGTGHMIERARAAKLPLRVIPY